jgi:hypothetical protein
MALNRYDVNIIVPKEATNLVTNPSIEVVTTGHTAVGSGVSVARVTTQSRRGIASLEVTTAVNVIAGVSYDIVLSNAVIYSFSADILDVVGQEFNLYIAAVGGAPKSSVITWTGTGYWKRKSVTWTADSSTTFALYITRSSVNSTSKYYVDGFQLEAGAVSTYIDGDMQGYVVGQTDYRWNGTRHASTSWRSGQSRSGGSFVSLSTYMKILTIPGLGMAMLTNIAVPSTMGGSFYQNTVPQERAFAIVGNINKSGDYALIEAARSALINAVKPDLVTVKQPLLIQIDQLDANSSPIAETLEIKASYEGGLEMDGSGNAYNEKLSLNFRQWMPMIQQSGEHGQTLGYQQNVANAGYILQRSSGGAWAEMAGGANNTVRRLAKSPSGLVYASGFFTNLGTASGDYIASWNGTAWAALASGTGGVTRALAVAADGTLYAGGDFTNLTDANGDYISQWNGSAWSSLGSGLNDARVWDLVIDKSGILYAGGAFTNGGGVAAADYIAKWDGSTWTALSTGMDAAVLCLAAGPDGTIYAGGDFHTAGGVTVAHIAKWDGTAWTALGAGLSDYPQTLFVAPDGTLYAGGVFATAGGVTVNKIAKWNGVAWSALGSGINGSIVQTIGMDDKNNLYVGGLFTSAGGVSTTDGVAIWNGSWMPLDVKLPNTPTLQAFLYDKISGVVYIGFDDTGTAVSAVVTAPNIGSAVTYPVITFTGPGTTYQLKNYTTGKSIFFNLTLLAGETAVLNLDPLHVSFISSFRGSIMNAILPGSNLNWELLPGANNVSAFMYGSTTGASGITMTWKDSYWSVDGAVR